MLPGEVFHLLWSQAPHHGFLLTAYHSQFTIHIPLPVLLPPGDGIIAHFVAIYYLLFTIHCSQVTKKRYNLQAIETARLSVLRYDK